MLRDGLNVTVIVDVPALLLDDEMYCMSCTPLICSSSGFVTADSTVCASAPMYVLVTTTCGGAICGYCAIGSVGMETRPTRKMSAEMTPARIGRLTKMANMRYFTAAAGLATVTGAPSRRPLGCVVMIVIALSTPEPRTSVCESVCSPSLTGIAFALPPSIV